MEKKMILLVKCAKYYHGLITEVWNIKPTARKGQPNLKTISYSKHAKFNIDSKHF